jgi:hypothetical protein
MLVGSVAPVPRPLVRGCSHPNKYITCAVGTFHALAWVGQVDGHLMVQSTPHLLFMIAGISCLLHVKLDLLCAHSWWQVLVHVMQHASAEYVWLVADARGTPQVTYVDYVLLLMQVVGAHLMQ